MEVGHVGQFGWKWLCEDLSDKSPHLGATQEQTVNQTPSRMSEWIVRVLGRQLSTEKWELEDGEVGRLIT